jgi:hypothetical protein
MTSFLELCGAFQPPRRISRIGTPDTYQLQVEGTYGGCEGHAAISASNSIIDGKMMV